MKNIFLLILLLLILLFSFTACDARFKNNEDLFIKESITSNPTSTPDLLNINPKLSEGVLNSQLKSTAKYFEYFSEKDENLIFSPLSINTALSMLYLGSELDAKAELEEILCYEGIYIKEVVESYSALRNIYNKVDDVAFSSANSIWIDNDIDVKSTYLDLIDRNFGAEIKLIDIQSNDSSIKINNWVSTKTNNMIRKIVDESISSSDAKLLLINALYFSGFWTNPFDPMFTREMEFHGTKSNTNINMMTTQMDVLGYNHSNCKSAKLPYGDDERFSMIAVIPQGNIEEFVDNLSYESIKSLISDFKQYDNKNIYLPKFTVENTIDLKDVLINSGHEELFSGMELSLISDYDLKINTIVHKAKIDVNEEGTKAAAVTFIGVTTSEKKIDFEFIANKPFIFFMVDNEYDVIVFCGKICNLK